MSFLERSWSAFSDERAERYLVSDGSPSPESRDIVGDVLQKLASRRGIAVLDLGCGNGWMYRYLAERQIPLRYTGVDFSEPLLNVARRLSPEAEFVRDDVEQLSTVRQSFDVVLYSHVLEMLGSPQAALLRAAELAPVVIIRFFNPPENDVDSVEIAEMDVGGKTVPYLRRSMSHDYYRLLLASTGCSSVDVYHCEFSRDQVHVCSFDTRGRIR